MGSTINVNFNTDLPEEDLEMFREKIRTILRGDAVPAAEVLGQVAPGKKPRKPRKPDKGGVDKGDIGTVGASPQSPF